MKAAWVTVRLLFCSGNHMLDYRNAESFLTLKLGEPSRRTLKVLEWTLQAVSLILQIDQPNREAAAFLWLPYPTEGQSIPDIALEYAPESGRHSGTYGASGLEKGKGALKLTARTEQELEGVVAYFKAMASNRLLPEISASHLSASTSALDDPSAARSSAAVKQRREAIPRAVQREIWQRDGGRCVECDSKERLCYDHIIPFSRGGSNTIRNLQLLCEHCNLSKGNRI
jgi:HNH endonuclease